MLMFRYEQPSEQVWGVDFERGFTCDWWVIGGLWDGWGREVRKSQENRSPRDPQPPIPRFIVRNAVWTEDLTRVPASLVPIAIVTPYGEWEESASTSDSDKPTIRERKARTSWIRRVRRLMRAYQDCLAVAVDYHS